MIEMFLTKKVDIYRLSDESGDMEKYESIYTDVPFHIQPLDDSFGEDLYGARGKDFMAATKLQDIQEYDKIVEGNNEYIVVGISKMDFMGEKHLQLRIKLQENGAKYSI